MVLLTWPSWGLDVSHGQLTLAIFKLYDFNNLNNNLMLSVVPNNI